jgi:segregation and condensation protein A
VSDPTGYQVELEVFEGPLDLLLHLVRKHELDIMDIPIAFVTEKYLQYLDLMTSLNLDVAGEYLLMAATLAHIKSRELLPTPPPLEPGEDGELDEDIDPRQELIRRLLDYQKYKQAGEHLGGRPVVGRNVWLRGAPREDAVAEGIDLDRLAPLADIPVLKLVEALDRVLRSAKVRVTHQVHVDRLSVAERINQLADRLEREGPFAFSSCFSFLRPDAVMGWDEIRHEAVVTFLAVLEMAKLGLIGLSQAEAQEAGETDIYISAVTDRLREAVAAKIAATGDDYRG